MIHKGVDGVTKSFLISSGVDGFRWESKISPDDDAFDHICLAVIGRLGERARYIQTVRAGALEFMETDPDGGWVGPVKFVLAWAKMAKIPD